MREASSTIQLVAIESLGQVLRAFPGSMLIRLSWILRLCRELLIQESWPRRQAFSDYRNRPISITLGPVYLKEYCARKSGSAESTFWL
jgi:hypothetical protein